MLWIAISAGVVTAHPAAPAPQGDAAAAPEVDAVRVPTVESVTGAFQRLLFAQSPVSRHRVLRSLRRLRDPELRSLFVEFATRDDPQMRQQGILGLAELHDPPVIDTILIKQVRDPGEQALLLGEALRQDLLRLEDIRDLTRWPDLDPSVRVLVLGELRRRGDEIGAERFRGFLNRDDLDDTPAVAIFAALQLDAAVGDAGAHDEILASLERILDLDPGRRGTVLSVVTEHIRDWSLVGGRPILEHLIDDPDVAPKLRFDAFWALLQIAPDDDDVVRRWIEHLDAVDGLGERLRFALATLRVAERQGQRLDVRITERFASADDSLLRAIGHTARRIADGERSHEALRPLVSQAHPASMIWALRLAERDPEISAGLVAYDILTTVRDRPERSEALVDAALIASTVGAGLEPEAFSDLVREAIDAGDAGLAGIVLAGALQSRDPQAVLLAEAIDSDNRSLDSIGTILRAKADRPPERDAFGPLGEVALGRGQLDDAARVQAAWLALSARRATRSALVRVLDERTP